MIQTQPAQVNDFSGGLVDNYINAAPNRAAVLNNLVILEDKSLLLRPGSVLDVATDANAQIPSGTTPIRALINYKNSTHLVVQAAKRIYYRNPTAYTHIAGPSGNDCFDLGDANSIPSYTQWQGHLFLTNSDFAKIQKVFKDDGGVMRLRTAGLPSLATSPSISAGAVGTRSYIYAFHYYYEYKVANQTFADAGPTKLVELTNSGDPSLNPNSITAIPVITNGATGNYDTATIKVHIFRSQDGGTTYYKLGEVTNGTTTFNDNYADSVIVDNEIIYTEGDVVNNDEPPRAKYIHVVQNRMYAAHLKEGTEILPNDYLQSVPDDPDSMPATFRDTVEDEITGINSVREIPIIGCKKHVYRVEGVFDEQGRGEMQHIRLHDTAGCVSNNSFVQAEQGLFWAGNDGFYYTDGFKTFKISDGINLSYKSFISENTGSLERITGTFDEENRRIIWTIQRDSASFEQDSMFVLDLRWGISPDMPFTTWDGTGDSFRPTALVFYGKDLYRGDSRGYVLKHSFDYSTDPKINGLAAQSTWARTALIYNYVSVATNFGTDFVRKWVSRVLLSCRNRSNISIQILAINDDGKLTRSLSPIRFRQNFTWDDPEFEWGNENCVWLAVGMIEEWRRMPARGLRCSHMQLQVTNAYTIITNSDTLGTATVNNITKQVVLDDAVTVDWPLDSVDYFISFENDNYSQEFLVTARSNDTLTFQDISNLSPNGSYKWLLKGYRKEEILNLLSYTVHFAPLTKSHTNVAGTNTGVNA